MIKTNLTRREALKLGAGALGAAALPLAGCGSGSGSESGSGSGTDSGEKDSYKVAIVISGPAMDGGWGQGHYESLRRACENHPKWEMLEPKENTATADAATAAQSYVDQDVDLIIAAGNEFASAWGEVVAEAAEEKPAVKFLMTNTDPEVDLAEYETLNNLECVQTNLVQTGALAGVVAGSLTQSGHIGFIGGMKLPTTLTKYSAYVLAAQKVNDKVEGHYNFEAGFTDASFGTKLTEQWIAASDVDVMWGDASAVDNGARQALEAAGADTHFDIAQPIDAVGDSQPTVVASTVIDWMIGQAMDEVESGSFGSGKVIEANMDNGGVYLGTIADKVPADVKSRIEGYVDEVKAGALITEDEVDAYKATL